MNNSANRTTTRNGTAGEVANINAQAQLVKNVAEKNIILHDSVKPETLYAKVVKSAKITPSTVSTHVVTVALDKKHTANKNNVMGHSSNVHYALCAVIFRIFVLRNDKMNLVIEVPSK